MESQETACTHASQLGSIPNATIGTSISEASKSVEIISCEPERVENEAAKFVALRPFLHIQVSPRESSVQVNERAESPKQVRETYI